jgi:hypothetical protein
MFSPASSWRPSTAPLPRPASSEGSYDLSRSAVTAKLAPRLAEEKLGGFWRRGDSVESEETFRDAMSAWRRCCASPL